MVVSQRLPLLCRQSRVKLNPFPVKSLRLGHPVPVTVRARAPWLLRTAGKTTAPQQDSPNPATPPATHPRNGPWPNQPHPQSPRICELAGTPRDLAAAKTRPRVHPSKRPRQALEKTGRPASASDSQVSLDLKWRRRSKSPNTPVCARGKCRVQDRSLFFHLMRFQRVYVCSPF
jgi:hypothetical protein